MKTTFGFVALLLAAFLARFLIPRSIGLSWAIDKYTHRNIDLNVLVFWVLLTVLFLWMLAALILRLRSATS